MHGVFLTSAGRFSLTSFLYTIDDSMLTWKRRRAVELVEPDKRTARTDDVKRVIKDMQNSPTAAYLRELSFHERLMLAALLRCVKREGVEEIKWGDVRASSHVSPY